jgi:glutamyl-tRNA synthetase
MRSNKGQDEMSADVKDRIRKAAVINAIRHDGKAELQAVLGNLLGDSPELRNQARQLIPAVRDIINEVNSTPIERLREVAAEKWPTEILKGKTEEERQLPPLPNVEHYAMIVTRLAPNPDFVLHIGNARAAILSHDYARIYKGKFIVRFEDTDPRLKKAQLEYYEKIREDLKWLECDWDEEYIQSGRLPIYYDVAQTLIRKGAGYVCECNPEQFRASTNASLACADRDLSIERQEKRWQRMVMGGYKEGEAVFRVKTDLQHPNPAVRDWPALRIIDTQKAVHPRVGSAFKVWPLYNLASGVDDHLLGITHIIRGKEHLTNMERQLYLYSYLGWTYPDAVHYGRLKVEGMDLSKSKLMKALETGEVQGIDDPRLGTIAALRRRGYKPETIRRLIWEVGPKPVDVTISWDNINSLNRKIVDPAAHRYFFVSDPIQITISGIVRNYAVTLPLHPQHSDQGTRTLKVQSKDGLASVFVARSDVQALQQQKVVRLMGLFNVGGFHSEDGNLTCQYLRETTENEKTPIVQWVPSEENATVAAVMPDATIITGLAESGLKSENEGAIIQFVRFGFCRLDQKAKNKVSVYFAHQ